MKHGFSDGVRLALLATATLAFVFHPKEATASLSIKLQSSGGTTLVVEDNVGLDANPEVGAVTFAGSIDNFSVVVMTALSKPIISSSSQAELTLSGVASAETAGGTLIVTLGDTDYLLSPSSGPTTLTSFVGGTTTGQTSFQAYLDTSNAQFGTMGASVCTPGLQGPFGPPAFDSTEQAACTLGGAFSLTAVTEILFAAGTQSFGWNLVVPAPEVPLACRFTGGGVDTDGNWNHVLESGKMIRNGAGQLPAGTDRYQFGGQVGARTAQQPQPSGEWQHHQQTGPSESFSFHGGTSSAADGTRIVDVRCSDPGFCNPARHAPVKQLDFDAIGTFSNVGKGSKAPVFEIGNPNVIPEPNGGSDKVFSFHWFEVNIDDLGEPGRLNSGAPDSAACPGRGFGEKSGGPFVPDPVFDPGTTVILPTTELADCDCPDFYRITVYKGVLSNEVTFLPDGRIDPASMDRSTVIYEAFGYIDGGNLQIHPPTGFDSN